MNRKSNRKNRGQSSSLTLRPTGSQTWQSQAQPWPAFNNTLKKDNSEHHFIQTNDLGVVVTTSTTVPVFYARSFTYTDVNQVTSFTAIFDQYRIDEVEVWMVPNLSATTNNSPSLWYSVVDYDDAVAPTMLATLQQYTNVIMTPMSNGHYVRFKPHCAEAVYAGAFTSYGNILAPWIDSTSSSVQHYGFKAGFNSTPNAYGVQMVIRFHFSCRNVY